MSSLPTPLRAAIGIALTVVDTARETATHLPQKAAGLPVAVASQAVQLSLRAQQQYAAYVNKGDELIGAFRGAPEEPPAWATFDEDEPTPARNTAFDRVPDAEDELDALQALDELEDLADDLALDPTDSPALDAALDVLTGDDEFAAGPQPTPGAPDTDDEIDVTPTGVGEEVIGADAPRTTASREPARKATRKTATKASRKVTAKAPPAKKAPGKKAAAPPPSTAAGATGGLPASPAVKAARKVAKKAATKAAPPPSPADPTVSDTEPGDSRPDQL